MNGRWWMCNVQLWSLPTFSLTKGVLQLICPWWSRVSLAYYELAHGLFVQSGCQEKVWKARRLLYDFQQQHGLFILWEESSGLQQLHVHTHTARTQKFIMASPWKPGP